MSASYVKIYIRYTDKHASSNIKALLGSDTTTTTMRWALYYMATHQDIQNKVHQEIVERFGIDEHPSYADRTKLPFTEATLLEIQRSSTLLPLSLPHRVMDEVNFMGYTFPNDTMVVPLIWAVHHDEKYFPAPDQFEPSRFLDEKGNVRKNMPLVPFSVGKKSLAFICTFSFLNKRKINTWYIDTLYYMT